MRQDSDYSTNKIS